MTECLVHRRFIDRYGFLQLWAGARQPAVTFQCVLLYLSRAHAMFYIIMQLTDSSSSSGSTASDLEIKNENVQNSRNGSREVGRREMRGGERQKLQGIDFFSRLFYMFFNMPTSLRKPLRKTTFAYTFIQVRTRERFYRPRCYAVRKATRLIGCWNSTQVYKIHALELGRRRPSQSDKGKTRLKVNSSIKSVIFYFYSGVTYLPNITCLK